MFLHMSIRQLVEVVGAGPAYGREGVTVPGFLGRARRRRRVTILIQGQTEQLGQQFWKFFLRPCQDPSLCSVIAGDGPACVHRHLLS